jgi:hypothetical protein
MAPVREVAFELECFEWAEERLEVAGRWKGLSERRLTRPVLTVTVPSGRRKRLAALPGGQMAPAAESWRATFAWAGDPGEITSAALEVGGSLVVDLPLPDRRRRRRKRGAPDAGDEALRSEVGALRAQVERLRAELAGRERELMGLRAEVDSTGPEEQPAAPADDAQQMTVAIQRLTDERDEARAELSSELERLRREHGEAEQEFAAERARWKAELDELREAFSEAAAEAETVRDRHREALEALHEQLAVERAHVARLSMPKAAPTAHTPGPATQSARRAAAAPPTEILELPAERRARPSGKGVPEQPGEEHAGGPAAMLASLRTRLGGMFASNGDGHAAESPPEPRPVRPGAPRPGSPRSGAPRPVRTASAARARAGATVAGRRSSAEVWGLRILAVVVVAVMLLTLLLFLLSLA